MARVEAVLRRFGKDIVAGELTVNAMTRTVYLSGKELDLTRREHDLLYYLIVNRSLTFSREQLRNKLGACADYIKTVHCVGYQNEADGVSAHIALAVIE